MYRTFHLQHQQPAQKAMGALGITLRILKNLKPDPFCLFLEKEPVDEKRRIEKSQSHVIFVCTHSSIELLLRNTDT